MEGWAGARSWFEKCPGDGAKHARGGERREWRVDARGRGGRPEWRRGGGGQGSGRGEGECKGEGEGECKVKKGS